MIQVRDRCKVLRYRAAAAGYGTAGEIRDPSRREAQVITLCDSIFSRESKGELYVWHRRIRWTR